MKKLLAILMITALIVSMFTFTSSAADALPQDITADIKWVTAYDMYAQKLPIVRADAVFIPAPEYDASKVAKAPGAGMRTITFTDWETAGMEFYFDDYFNLGDGYFMYDAVWANSNETEYDHGLLQYTFEVEEAGTYELVVVGCAQIKADAVDNDEKDRGFAFSFDGGEIKQVNISDTNGIFRDYSYTYGKAELDSTQITTTNGVNSQYYQMTYFYGIPVELTAGTHTFEYYHLFSSGEFVFQSGNGPRLNYAGAYVQKFLTDVELENYQYPVIETQEVTTTEAPETTPAVPEDTTTEAPAADTTTAAPEVADTTTAAPTTNAPTTEAPKDNEGGCGGFVALGIVAALIPAAVVIRKKRD